LEKFDSKSDKAIFLSYSTTSKAYKAFNLKTRTLEESMHIKLDEFKELENQERIVEEDEEESQINSNKNSHQQSSNEDAPQSPPRSWRIVGHHPQEQIIGETTDGVRTRRSFQTNDMTKMIY